VKNRVLCQQIEVSLGSVRNRTSAVFAPFVQYARQLGARIFAGNAEGICTTTAAKLGPRSFVCGLLIRYRNDSIALLSQSNLLILRNSWPTLEIGRTLHRYGPKQVIFSQGKPAVAVYYIQEGEYGSAWSPNRARKQPSRCSGLMISWAKDASLPINPCAWRPLLQLPGVLS